MWSSANYLPIARSYASEARAFVDRLALRPGDSLLDVACGTGNLAIPAACAGARVCAIDIAPNLIAEARAEARVARCAIDFTTGDAATMPFSDGQFDTTVSMFGAIFVSRPERAASEMLRVTRRGGRIVLANWLPHGFVQELNEHLVALLPGAPRLSRPLDWGDEDIVHERFGNGVRSLQFTRRPIELRFSMTPAAVAELCAKCHGPTVAALNAAAPSDATLFRDAATDMFAAHNTATDGTTILCSEYLEVVARLR